MAKNATALITAFQDWLGLDNNRLPRAVGLDIINAKIREILRPNDLRYGETSDTFPTVASDHTYDLPTLWKVPHTLWYVHPTNSAVVFLDLLDKEKFDLNFPDTTKTGLPTAYTIWGDEIQLGKTPDRIITIHRNYQGYLADLTDTSDTAAENEFTRNAWDVLLFNCLADVSAYGIEDARIPMWQLKGEKLLDALVIEHAHAKSAGAKSQSEEPG